MNLDFDETQLMLRSGVREFIDKEFPVKKALESALDAKVIVNEIWPTMKSLGWMGVPFPEAYGGGGLGFFELLLMLEEMSRGALYTPYLSTMLCGMAINQFGSEKQKKELIPQISNGDLVFSLAWLEENLNLEPAGVTFTATKQSNGTYKLEGTKILAPYANLADKLIVVVRTSEATGNQTGGITVFVVPAKDPSIKIKPEDSIGFDYLSIVTFDNVSVDGKSILGQEGAGWPIVERLQDQGALCHCAEMIGACDHSLQMSLDYSKERVVYGKPVGSYQIQQHRLADMWMNLEGSREFFYDAAWHYTQNPDTMLASKAKELISDKAECITENAVRVHGAIGLTWELGLGLYYRRVRANAAQFGDASFHKRRIIRMLKESMRV